MNEAHTHFSLNLYAEHMEEAAFLYDQRGVLLHEEGGAWTDLSEVETRFEAHLDALAIGKETALEVCSQCVFEGAPGERHAAVRVFCRQDRRDLLEQVIDRLGLDDTESVLAVRNALKHEWPRSWGHALPRLFAERTEASLAVLAKAIGYRRLPADNVLVASLPVCPRDHRYPLIWALGRLKTGSARPLLLSCLEDENLSHRAAAALALLRIGKPLPFLHPTGERELDMPYLIAEMFSGGEERSRTLIKRIEGAEWPADLAVAIGVLGDSRAVEPLIDLVGDKENGEAAALALNLITGGDLFEEVFVAESIDRDELFDEELALAENNEAIHPPDQVPGETIEKLTQDRDVWKAWWREHRSSFQNGMRYRNGRPYSPIVLVENLRSEKSPSMVRQIAAEELVIRYGIDVPFETDMTVSEQLTALDQMVPLSASAAETLKAGHWYFSGELID